MSALHDAMRREFPLLWERSSKADYDDRMGRNVDPLDAEADAAMREIFSARTFLADFSPDGEPRS